MSNKKPTVFFDRDGVVCEHVPYLNHISQFKLRQGIGQGLALLSKSGFLSILITNQPMVAMGLLTLEELSEIHNKMQEDLSQFGAKFDGIYFCPHSPDIRPIKDKVIKPVHDLIRTCDCRKPKIGMFERALLEWPVDKSKAYMIGDSWRDIEAARNFGITDIGVLGGDGFINPKTKISVTPSNTFNSPLEAINYILEYEDRISSVKP